MPRYKVTHTRTVHEYAELIIEAINEEEAEQIALAHVKDGTLLWEGGDVDENDRGHVINVEEVL